MNNQVVFNFKTDISNLSIPSELNNPFETNIPEMAQLAAHEFQEYITRECKNWDYDFTIQKGKMFGVLVVQKEDDSLGYLGAVSGTLASGVLSSKMIRSVFNESENDLYISKGLTAITKLGLQIKESKQ